MKNCQEQKLDENSAVENRIENLDEGYRTILKETMILKEMIEKITDITNELKKKEHFFNSTNYQDMFSKTESHEAKLETLEKNITNLQKISNSAQQLPGQNKTEQIEFISKKIEEQKTTLELFFKSIDVKIKKLETIHNQEVNKF